MLPPNDVSPLAINTIHKGETEENGTEVGESAERTDAIAADAEQLRAQPFLATRH